MAIKATLVGSAPTAPAQAQPAQAQPAPVLRQAQPAPTPVSPAPRRARGVVPPATAGMRQVNPNPPAAATRVVVAPAPVIEVQTVAVQGEVIECTNTATPAPVETIGSILPEPNDESAESGVAVEAAPVVEQNSMALAVAAASLPTRSASLFAVAGLEGEFSASDFRPATLKIVQGSGPLSVAHQEGSLLLGKELLFTPPDPRSNNNPFLKFLVVRIKKQYRENLTKEEQDNNLMPRTVDTEAEAIQLGGSLKKIGDERSRWSPSGKCLLLIEKPDLVYADGTPFEHPEFIHELDGKLYALANYYASGGAYSDFVSLIVKVAQARLHEVVIGEDGKPVLDEQGRIQKRVNLAKRFFNFRYSKKSRGKFNPYGPDITLDQTTEVGPEAARLVQQLLSAEIQVVDPVE